MIASTLGSSALWRMNRSTLAAKLSYGMRKTQLDAFISSARTRSAIGRISAWLDSTSTAGIPLRQPTRWAIVTHLVERDTPGADTLITAEARRDTTPNGKRSAFVAGAARPRADVKRDYFDRYFRDTTLNEDWATASLRGEPRVLLVDSEETNGRALADVLRREKIAVETRGLSGLPKSLEDLQQFDLFILSDVSALRLGASRWISIAGGCRTLAAAS